MNNMKFIREKVTSSFLILFIFVLLTSNAIADVVDDRVQAIMAERHIPGAAIAVVKNGRVVRMKSYGVASLEFGVPVTTDTVFEIGSVSKQITAAAIMLLVQDGKVSIDERISKYLPNTPEAWREVTVRHLLTHTSGIKSYTSLEGFELSRRMTIGDFITKLSPHPLEFTPGERNIYSNSGYNLLAYIIETQSGKKYIDFMREKIFIPLGMTRTGDRDPRNIIRMRAAGYEWRGDAHSGRDGSLTDLMGAGSIVSTIADIAKWEAALRGDKLLTAESKKMIWTQFTFNNGKLSPYGFGWRISDVRGHKLIAHSGQTAGFGAAIHRYVDDDVSVIALTNLGEIGMGTLIALDVAKQYIPSMSLKAVKTGLSVDPTLAKSVEAAVRGRFDEIVDGAIFTDALARSLGTERSKQIASRLKKYAPLGDVRIVKRETVEGKDTLSVIAHSSRRIFLWRVVADENGKIAELNLEEEE